MFKNYLNVLFRNLWKNKFFVFSNILGLGIGLACCVTAYLNFRFDTDYNNQHENTKRIFAVNVNRNLEGELVPYGVVPAPIGPALKQDFPNVAHSVRFSRAYPNLKLNDDFFSIRTGYADANFLDVFTVPLLKGDRSALQDRSQVLISDRLVERHFPDSEPVGQAITLAHGNGKEENYTIAGVFEHFPLNSSFQFDMLTHFENYIDLREFDPTNWEELIQVTFVELEDPEKAAELEGQMQKYIPTQNAAREDWQVANFYLQPLPSMAQAMVDIRSTYLREGLPREAVIVPGIMSALLLLLACFNFTNTSIAIAGKRLKEIGVRKVLGGNRLQLVFQFLGENFVLCFLALLVGLLIAEALVPGYSSLWGFLDLHLSYTDNADFLVFLVILLIVTALFAGSYPSLYISGVQPASILKGSMKLSGTNGFTRTLLTLQFSIALLAIISGVIFVQNAEYQRQLDLGFDTEKVMYARVNSAEEFTALKSRLSQNPKIEKLSGSQHHISWDWESGNFKYFDKELDIEGLTVDSDYLNTMEITLVEGRNFEGNSATDQQESVIVSERFVADFGIEQPLGAKVIMNDTLTLNIVGVIQDIYLRGFWGAVEPTFLKLSKPDQNRYVTFTAQRDDMSEVKAYFKSAWAAVVPDRPFDLHEQYETVEGALEVNDNIKLIFGVLAFVALLLSVAGLHSLVTLNILRKMRELGVRKVLGATLFNIANNINREFFIILLVASLLGSVAAFFLVEMLLESLYTYYIPMNAPAFAISIFMVFFTSTLTVGTKVYRAASANPVNALRDN